jgi:hypothetical protein
MISSVVGSPSEAATRLSDDTKTNAQRPTPNAQHRNDTETQNKQNNSRNKVGRTRGLSEQKQTQKKKGGKEGETNDDEDRSQQTT